MKIYKITLRDRWGGEMTYTVPAFSLYEAMKKLRPDPGWQFERYSIMGVTK